jgi:hypothetical protein
MAKDPATIAKAINDSVESALRATEAGRSNPFSACYIVSKQKLTHGVQADIRHSLGVPWQYAYVVHAYPTTYVACITLIEAQSPPSGVDRTNNASIIPAIIAIGVPGGTTVTAASGTYDILLAAS